MRPSPSSVDNIFLSILILTVLGWIAFATDRIVAHIPTSAQYVVGGR